MRTPADSLLGLAELLHGEASALTDQRAIPVAELAQRLQRLGDALAQMTETFREGSIPDSACDAADNELRNVVGAVQRNEILGETESMQLRMRFDRLRRGDRTILALLVREPALLSGARPAAEVVSAGSPNASINESDLAKVDRAARYFNDLADFLTARSTKGGGRPATASTETSGRAGTSGETSYADSAMTAGLRRRSG